MGNLRRFNLKKICSTTPLRELVETGTGKGDSVAWALPAGFSRIASCEVAEQLHTEATERFRPYHFVELHKAPSVEFLQRHTPAGPTLYFLDAHYYGGADFGLQSRESVLEHVSSFPLCDELAALLGKEFIKESLIIIDDARIYYNDEFQQGRCPEHLMRPKDLPALSLILRKFTELHGMKVETSLRDHGYILILPTWCDSYDQYLNILSHDVSEPVFLRPEIQGVTGIALSRRMRDSRFATTYLRGSCLDVGGGNDSLALYREFFPFLGNVFRYDLEAGDGQCLDNVPDAEFDCLYSSHCLEHVQDCVEGLKNWIRVVKPGGFLIITVPDEDLYEQGVWPSAFAKEHHLRTFTLNKQTSWSPKSVNILPLLIMFTKQVRLHKAELVDSGYHRHLGGRHFDQTRLPYGECSIELILQKI